MVNWAYANYIKEHKDQELFIASPCPTVVAMIQTQYPDLVKYLMPIVSPMEAMAKVHKNSALIAKLFLFLRAGQKKMLRLQNIKK